MTDHLRREHQNTTYSCIRYRNGLRSKCGVFAAPPRGCGVDSGTDLDGPETLEAVLISRPPGREARSAPQISKRERTAPALAAWRLTRSGKVANRRLHSETEWRARIVVAGMGFPCIKLRRGTSRCLPCHVSMTGAEGGVANGRGSALEPRRKGIGADALASRTGFPAHCTARDACGGGGREIRIAERDSCRVEASFLSSWGGSLRRSLQRQAMGQKDRFRVIRQLERFSV